MLALLQAAHGKSNIPLHLILMAWKKGHTTIPKKPNEIQNKVKSFSFKSTPSKTTSTQRARILYTKLFCFWQTTICDIYVQTWVTTFCWISADSKNLLLHILHLMFQLFLFQKTDKWIRQQGIRKKSAQKKDDKTNKQSPQVPYGRKKEYFRDKPSERKATADNELR